MIEKIINKILALKEWLKGKKTFMISFAGILTATAAVVCDEISFTVFIQTILPLLGLSAIRAGMKNGK